MNNELRARIETEICRIADQLVSDADWNESFPWMTLTTDGDSNYHFARSDSMYGGSAGIALFLLETGRFAGEQRYTNTAEKAITAILEECRQKPSPYFAFITGRMSVSFVALRFFQRTGKREYLSQALELVRGCQEFLTPHSADDFINGTSGTLLGLLLLHEASGEEWLLELANDYVRHLLSKAQPGAQGLYWDRTHRQIRGLCGFSHGAAGIGFVFAEAARYVNNSALNYIAEQAYWYEERYYNPAVGNWADFRKGIYRDEDQQEHEENYRNGNMEFFTQGGYMNAWCHGAAGIGLSRLRATELFTNPLYRTEADNAIAMTVKTNVAIHNLESNFSLCHGGGGNADVFIEAYRLTKDDKYLQYCETVAAMALEQFARDGSYRSGFGMAAPTMEDRSLYMGIAGVGYFYLRLLDPMNTPSVEAPRLEAPILSSALSNPSPTLKERFPFLFATQAKIRTIIIEKIFARTLRHLNESAPQALEEYLGTNDYRINELPAFIAFVEALLPKLSEQDRDALVSVFGLERAKYYLEMRIESASYLFIRTQLEHKRAQEAIVSEDFPRLRLQIDSFAEIVETDAASILLYAHALGVAEQQLSPFGALVLSTFTSPHTVEEGLERIAEQIDHEPEQREQISAAAENQIKQLLLVGALRIL